MGKIIGISGYAGAGKDTVAKIIQGIDYYYNGYGFREDSYTKYIVELLKGDHCIPSVFYNKKFADPLKDILCILLGCTREDLENREFKEKELGKEWWFSEWVDIDYYDYKIREYNCPPEDGWIKIKQVKTTPRILMQKLGTDLLRNRIHPDVFVNSLFSKYHSGFNWVISDVRFKNEVQAIKNRGGVVIRLLQGEPLQDHKSETELDNYDGWDYVIDNTETSIEELIEKVKEIMIKENII